jgi:hypothetical protein
LIRRIFRGALLSRERTHKDIKEKFKRKYITGVAKRMAHFYFLNISLNFKATVILFDKIDSHSFSLQEPDFNFLKKLFDIALDYEKYRLTKPSTF